MPTSRLLLKNKPFACAAARQHVTQLFVQEGIGAERVDLVPLAVHNAGRLHSMATVQLQPGHSGCTHSTYCGCCTQVQATVVPAAWHHCVSVQACMVLYFSTIGWSRPHGCHVPCADHLAMYGEADISLDTFPYAGTTTTCESLYMGVPCVTLMGACHAQNVGVSLMTTVGLADAWIADSEAQYVKLALKAAQDPGSLSELRGQLRQQMLQSPLCDSEGFVTDLEHCYRRLWAKWQQAGQDNAASSSVERAQDVQASP